jgi:hypothetical protein
MNERLRSALNAEQFDLAVDAFNNIEQERPLCADELVLKAKCLQLHPSVDARLLNAAEESLLAATKLDPQYVPALVELGWYYLNVQDDARKAAERFDSALRIASAAAVEALVGLSKCVEEIEGEAAAREVLEIRSVLADAVLTQDRQRLRRS